MPLASSTAQYEMNDISRQLRLEADAVHGAAKALCDSLDRRAEEATIALKRRCESLEAENNALRNRIRALELEDDTRFDQLRADGLTQAQLWDSERKRLEDEIQALRSNMDFEKNTAMKLKLHVASVEEELRARDSYTKVDCDRFNDVSTLEHLLLRAESERDRALAESVCVRQELAELKDRIRQGGY